MLNLGLLNDVLCKVSELLGKTNQVQITLTRHETKLSFAGYVSHSGIKCPDLVNHNQTTGLPELPVIPPVSAAGVAASATPNATMDMATDLLDTVG